MDQMMHLAAQYLATAGKSFLEKKEDDSHTNLGYSPQNRTLESWPLNDTGDTLVLSYDRFALEWKSPEVTSIFPLDGATHSEVVQWLEEVSSRSGLTSGYHYDLHYELPYTVDENFRFELSDTNRLRELSKLRGMAQGALESFMNSHGLNDKVRVWPHHFDSGIFFTLDDTTGHSVGLGLAIPDSVCETHYLYTSGYHGNKGIDTSGFGKLTLGEWKNDGFKGAVVAAINLNEEIALHFFNEAFSYYKNI